MRLDGDVYRDIIEKHEQREEEDAFADGIQSKTFSEDSKLIT